MTDKERDEKQDKFNLDGVYLEGDRGPVCDPDIAQYNSVDSVSEDDLMKMRMLNQGNEYHSSDDVRLGASEESDTKYKIIPKTDWDKLKADNARLREALECMTEQFAGWSDIAGGYTSDFLSALENAFDVLGWEDPHICEGNQCDEPGCRKRITCGTPTKSGYRSTCGKHKPEPSADAQKDQG